MAHHDRASAGAAPPDPIVGRLAGARSAERSLATSITTKCGPVTAVAAGPRLRSWTYNPAIDGLRALAVGAVLVYHGQTPWAPGGFLGVDLFFALSGYLITALLLVEHREQGF